MNFTKYHGLSNNKGVTEDEVNSIELLHFFCLESLIKEEQEMSSNANY